MTDKKEIKEEDLEKVNGGNGIPDMIISSPCISEPSTHDVQLIPQSPLPPSPPTEPNPIYEEYCIYCGYIVARYDRGTFPVICYCPECSERGIAVREVYE